MQTINWLALALASLIPMAVGYVYFHPKVLGQVWLDAIGKSDDRIFGRHAFLKVILGVLLPFITAFFMVEFNNGPGQEGQFDTFAHGAWHGFFISIVLALPIVVITSIFSMTRPKAVLIGMVFWIISLCIMGGIIDAMHHWPN